MILLWVFVVVVLVLVFVSLLAACVEVSWRRDREKAALDAEVLKFRLARLPERPRRQHGGGLMVVSGRVKRGTTKGAGMVAWGGDDLISFDGGGSWDGGGGFDGGCGGGDCGGCDGGGGD